MFDLPLFASFFLVHINHTPYRVCCPHGESVWHLQLQLQQSLSLQWSWKRTMFRSSCHYVCGVECPFLLRRHKGTSGLKMRALAGETNAAGSPPSLSPLGFPRASLGKAVRWKVILQSCSCRQTSSRAAGLFSLSTGFPCRGWGGRVRETERKHGNMR